MCEKILDKKEKGSIGGEEYQFRNPMTGGTEKYQRIMKRS